MCLVTTETDSIATLPNEWKHLLRSFGSQTPLEDDRQADATLEDARATLVRFIGCEADVGDRHQPSVDEGSMGRMIGPAAVVSVPERTHTDAWRGLAEMGRSEG